MQTSQLIGSLHTTLSIIILSTKFTQLLWTVGNNLPKKLCPVSKQLKHLNTVVYINKPMLVRVYLDPRQPSSTSRSEESGKYEVFVVSNGKQI